MIWWLLISIIVLAFVLMTAFLAGFRIGRMFGAQMTETRVIEDVCKMPSREKLVMLDRLFGDRKELYQPTWDEVAKKDEEIDRAFIYTACHYPTCDCPKSEGMDTCPANEILWEFSPKQPDQSGLL